MTRGASRSRSPTPGLLVGLILTLAAVVAYSLYINRQLAGLRVLQTDLVERNRKDSLQLLRIQNDLNQLGLAMRDMLDDDHALSADGVVARSSSASGGDLDEALASQAELAVATPDRRQQRDRLTDSLTQFWDAVDRIFALAAEGREEAARAQVSMSLQAQAGGAQHGGGAAARREQRDRGAGGAARCRRSTIRCSVRSTGSWPPR